MSRQCVKVHEFPAHAAQINCARFGEKRPSGASAGDLDGGMFCTGGQDMRVAVWEVGKPQCVAMLTAAKSAITTVAFDRKDELLVAGTSGGAVHMWNVEVRRAVAKLPGHRTQCTALEVHPYGEFVASGSQDTNMKLWDMRSYQCVQTYRGHEGPITCMRFSPHGRWIATGGEDGVVKIWDLSASRVLAEFPHKNPVTSIDFHTSQYHFIVGTAGRHTAVYNVETFESEGVTDLQASHIQKVKFDPDQDVFYTIASDTLRSYSISELGGAHDTIDARWGTGVKDCTFVDNPRGPNSTLCAIGVNGTSVQLWKVEEGKAPRRDEKPTSQKSTPALSPHGYSAQQRSFPSARSSPVVGPAGDSSTPHGRPPSIRRLDESRLQNRLSRDGGDGRNYSARDQEQRLSVASSTASDLAAAPRSGRGERCERGERTTSASSHGDKPSSTPAQSPPISARAPWATTDDLEEKCETSRSKKADPRSADGAQKSPSPTSSEDRQREPSPPRWHDIARDLTQRVTKQHNDVMELLNTRADVAKRMKHLWDERRMSDLCALTDRGADRGAFVDFIKAIKQHRLVQHLNLDACCLMLPILKLLVRSRYQAHTEAAVECVYILLQNFRNVIIDVRHQFSGMPGHKLDIAAGERLDKCDQSVEDFSAIRSATDPKKYRRVCDALDEFLVLAG